MKHKLLKKFVGWFGYKLVEKREIKNDRLLTKKTYINIHNIINFLIKKNEIRTIIQIGANDGKKFDDLSNYIKKNNIKSILVEPIVENFEKLKKNYENLDNVIFENSAVSINNEINLLYKVDEKYLKFYDDYASGITSFKIQHLIKHGIKQNHISSVNVNSISIKDLLIKYKIENLDLLYVDTEGYDGQIVNNFVSNFSLRSYIVFEYIHINENDFNSVIESLLLAKYNFFPINENIFCFPEEKKHLFIS